MSNFVERIEKALEEVGRSRCPQVNPADLRELLQHFKSMDAKERMHYPPHVEMMVDAAQKVVEWQEGSGDRLVTCVAELRSALNYSRPNWRTTK